MSPLRLRLPTSANIVELNAILDEHSTSATHVELDMSSLNQVEEDKAKLAKNVLSLVAKKLTKLTHVLFVQSNKVQPTPTLPVIALRELFLHCKDTLEQVEMQAGSVWLTGTLHEFDSTLRYLATHKTSIKELHMCTMDEFPPIGNDNTDSRTENRLVTTLKSRLRNILLLPGGLQSVSLQCREQCHLLIDLQQDGQVLSAFLEKGVMTATHVYPILNPDHEDKTLTLQSMGLLGRKLPKVRSLCLEGFSSEYPVRSLGTLLDLWSGGLESIELSSSWTGRPRDYEFAFEKLSQMKRLKRCSLSLGTVNNEERVPSGDNWNKHCVWFADSWLRALDSVGTLDELIINGETEVSTSPESPLARLCRSGSPVRSTLSLYWMLADIRQEHSLGPLLRSMTGGDSRLSSFKLDKAGPMVDDEFQEVIRVLQDNQSVKDMALGVPWNRMLRPNHADATLNALGNNSSLTTLRISISRPETDHRSFDLQLSQAVQNITRLKQLYLEIDAVETAKPILEGLAQNMALEEVHVLLVDWRHGSETAYAKNFVQKECCEELEEALEMGMTMLKNVSVRNLYSVPMKENLLTEKALFWLKTNRAGPGRKVLLSRLGDRQLWFDTLAALVQDQDPSVVFQLLRFNPAICKPSTVGPCPSPQPKKRKIS